MKATIITPVWGYEEYSRWARQLALSYTATELQKVVNECEFESAKYAASHLSAIKATNSMQGQSQRRAHARNNLSCNYSTKRAHLDAIEIHQFYPKFAKHNN